MAVCHYCGKEVDLPFNCSFCNLIVCDEHRLPEQHNCLNIPKRSWSIYKGIQAGRIFIPKHPKNTPKNRKPVHEPQIHTSPKKKSKKGLLLLFILIGVPITFLLVQNSNPEVVTCLLGMLKEDNAFSDPQIERPSNEDLVQHALLEINKERTKQGLSNVTLNNLDCAQKHAENMLEYGFISHWGTNGLKPYMRYTISGGKGYMTENVAWQRTTGTIDDPYDVINSLNWRMINDDANSNWAHRENLLASNINKVNIGVAWDDQNLFLVQDFEEDSFVRTEVSHIGERYGIEYETSKENWDPSQTVILIDPFPEKPQDQSYGLIDLSGFISRIIIYYDPYPENLSVSELSKPPYDNSYGLGEFVGSILPEPYYSEDGITINADKWTTSHTIKGNTIFSTSFSIAKAYQSHGKGIYTLILLEDGQPYTTYSIWHSGK